MTYPNARGEVENYMVRPVHDLRPEPEDQEWENDLDIEATIDSNLIRVSFPFNANLINRVKRIGLKWAPRTKTWESPFNYQVINGLSREFPNLDLSAYKLPEVNGWEPSPYLMAHQKEAAEIALKHSRYGFFDDTGTGKTCLSIEIIKQKKIKTLVICPLSLIENAWMKDIQTFAPELKAVNLWEAFKKRGRIPDHQVGVINFESFKNNLPKIKGYQMVMVDESSKAKDHRSQITKNLISFCDTAPFVYLFSGTPAPNSELEYYSQLRIIDQSLLGRSYYSFRNKFCYSGGFGGYEWKMRPDMKESFLEAIGKKSRVVRKEDVLDLPERTFNIRTVYLSDKEMAAYKKMENDLILEIEGQISVSANSAVKLLKLRQGSSGFFYDTEGKPMIFGHSKLNALQELLEEIGDHQVIIWTQFHEEADQVWKMLGDIAPKGEVVNNFVRVDGTDSNQERKNEAVRAFMNREVKYMISHPASLGHGVTLTNCQYAIYYSLSHSHELDYQSKDRIYRKGQKNACTYYNLIAHKTVDGEILKALERKASTAEAVFSYLKRNK